MGSGSLRLAIFSDCVHQYNKNGNVSTENHIFCHQMEAIAAYYKQTEIYCPFIESKTNTHTTVYNDSSIHFYPLPDVGGNRFLDKLKIIKTLPAWFSAFAKASKNADVIYQRFPNNLNIPGFFYFYFKKKKVFATYTGTWANYLNEPFTYRLQKWLLKRLFRGPVGAYLQNEKEGKNIIKTYSPSYTREQWEEETEYVNARIQKMKATGLNHPIFITVGALIKNKNQQFILDTFKLLHQQSFPFHLYIAGNGPLMQQYKTFIEQNGLQQNISLLGQVGENELRDLYRKTDFLVQAPIAEGYGKVPVEGFLHGVIPLLSNTALAKEMTGNNNERGYVFSIDNNTNITALIIAITRQNTILPSMILNGRAYAYTNNLDNWAQDYYTSFCNFYNLSKPVV